MQLHQLNFMEFGNQKFNNMEQKIEKIPTVKPEVHFLLNDISSVLISEGNIDDKQEDFLDTIWKSLQDLDKEMISRFSFFVSNKVLSREEAMCAANVFLTSLQVGPDLSSIRGIFFDENTHSADILAILEDISIPEHSRGLLIKVYNKIVSVKE